MKNKFEKIFTNNKIIKSISEYMTLKDILNLNLCSKSINNMIKLNNILILNILKTSSIP
jgi:hypothetical protein